MIAEIVLLTTIGLPLLLGLVFRVQTSHIFFSLMAGELLGRYFGGDIETQASPIISDSAYHGYGEVTLIIVPMITTAFFLRKTIAKGRLPWHIIPLAITGVVCAAFVLPVLPRVLQEPVAANQLGFVLLGMNRAIVGAMIVLQLIALWVFSHHSVARLKKDRH